MRRSDRYNRNSHMAKVEEHRILNGHYKKLLQPVKSAIDNRTPRSLYSNPRGKFHEANIRIRSQSADSKGKFSKTFPPAVNRPDSSMSTNHRRGLCSHVTRSSQLRQMSSSLQALNEIFNQPYTHETNVPGDRRYLNGDIINVHHYRFTQPGNLSTETRKPRIIASNVAQSKIAQSRNYQGPRRLKNSLVVPSTQLESSNTLLQIKKDLTQPLHVDISGHQKSFKDPDSCLNLSHNKSSSPNWDKYHSSLNITPIQREKVSPNIIRNTENYQKTWAHRQLEEKESELKYYALVQEVTRDILEAGVFSDRVLKTIIAHHIERRKHDLDVDRMQLMLSKLLDDIGVSKHGLLSVYAQKASDVNEYANIGSDIDLNRSMNQRKEWSAPEIAVSNKIPKKSLTEYPSDFENSEAESDIQKKSTCRDGLVSLNDSDINDLLAGKNITKVAKKLTNLKLESLDDKIDAASPSKSTSISKSKSSDKLVQGGSCEIGNENKGVTSAVTTGREVSDIDDVFEDTERDDVSELEREEKSLSSTSEALDREPESRPPMKCRSPLPSTSDLRYQIQPSERHADARSQSMSDDYEVEKTSGAEHSSSKHHKQAPYLVRNNDRRSTSVSQSEPHQSQNESRTSRQSSINSHHSIESVKSDQESQNSSGSISKGSATPTSIPEEVERKEVKVDTAIEVDSEEEVGKIDKEPTLKQMSPQQTAMNVDENRYSESDISDYGGNYGGERTILRDSHDSEQEITKIAESLSQNRTTTAPQNNSNGNPILDVPDLAEEVRKKRESFLQRLEYDESQEKNSEFAEEGNSVENGRRESDVNNSNHESMKKEENYDQDHASYLENSHLMRQDTFTQASEAKNFSRTANSDSGSADKSNSSSSGEATPTPDAGQLIASILANRDNKDSEDSGSQSDVDDESYEDSRMKDHPDFPPLSPIHEMSETPYMQSMNKSLNRSIINSDRSDKPTPKPRRSLNNSQDLMSGVKEWNDKEDLNNYYNV